MSGAGTATSAATAGMPVPADSDKCAVAHDVTAIRILDLRDSPWVDGPGRTILEIAQALNRSGFEYVIGSMTRDGVVGPYAEEATRRGLCVEAIHERSAHDLRIIGQTLQVLERRKVDVVHTHEFRSDLIGLLAARRRGAKLVSTVHGWIANDTKGRVYTILDKLILRFFDRVVVVSERLRSQLIRWGVRPGKIVVVPNALRVEQYQVNRSDNSYRRELGIADDAIVVANIGRLSAEKGHRDFLRAAHAALAQDKRLHFVLIGIGPEEQALRELTQALGIGPNVTFAGYCHDMVRAYNSIDLVVQSSFTEGMPNVMLEALLMEVPVVATDVGGTAEVVEHLRTGVLLEPGRPEALAERMVEFTRQVDRYRAMARAGRESVQRRFNAADRIEKMRAIYAELMATGARRRA